MEGFVDHYVNLGLPSGEEGAKLSEKEIKKAYRSKVKKWHPDKRPDDPNAHHNFLNLQASYTILMDTKARQTFHHRLAKKQIKRGKRNLQEQHSDSNSKRRRKTDVDEREQAARHAHSAQRTDRDNEESIRASNERVIAEIKRQAAASKAPPAPSTSNKEAAAIIQCPCGFCQADWLDKEFSSNCACQGDWFEAYEKFVLTKSRKSLEDLV